MDLAFQVYTWNTPPTVLSQNHVVNGYVPAATPPSGTMIVSWGPKTTCLIIKRLHPSSPPHHRRLDHTHRHCSICSGIYMTLYADSNKNSNNSSNINNNNSSWSWSTPSSSSNRSSQRKDIDDDDASSSSLNSPLFLQENQRRKLNIDDDMNLFHRARFEPSMDEACQANLKQLFVKYLKPNGRVLDLMSSPFSYLPPQEEVPLAYVEGHGMNEEELQENFRLASYFVKDFNKLPIQFPLADMYFDAVLMTSAFGYLEYPELVLREIHRVLSEEGVLVISFTDRFVWEKAIVAWRNCGEADRIQLITDIVEHDQQFKVVDTMAVQSPRSSAITHRQLEALREDAKKDSFYAVVAIKQG